jgi:hypothetical protein
MKSMYLHEEHVLHEKHVFKYITCIYRKNMFT